MTCKITYIFCLLVLCNVLYFVIFEHFFLKFRDRNLAHMMTIQYKDQLVWTDSPFRLWFLALVWRLPSTWLPRLPNAWLLWFSNAWFLWPLLFWLPLFDYLPIALLRFPVFSLLLNLLWLFKLLLDVIKVLNSLPLMARSLQLLLWSFLSLHQGLGDNQSWLAIYIWINIIVY